ncbi:MAG: hypothetical protein Q8Q57_08555 [Methylotenera sp.]|nr:hypothetical protein [Methylotenera sp.]
MKNTDSVPHFTLHLVHPEKHYSWCIVLDGEVMHHIKNFMSFYKALGYPEISPKVFDINSSVDNRIEYSTKEGFGSEACIQYKIVEYLIEHSEQFKINYTEYYTNLIGSCHSLSLLDNKNCIKCSMNPHKV